MKIPLNVNSIQELNGLNGFIDMGGRIINFAMKVLLKHQAPAWLFTSLRFAKATDVL